MKADEFCGTKMGDPVAVMVSDAITALPLLAEELFILRGDELDVL